MSLLAPPPRRSSRLWIWLTLAVLLLAGVGAAGWFFFFRTFTPLNSHEGKALGKAVPEYLVSMQENLRNGGPADVEKDRVGAALDPKMKEALGTDVSDRLQTLLRTSVDLTATKSTDRDLVNRFQQENILLDQAMVARELPYFVDASVYRFGASNVPILYTYYIERDNTLTAPEKRIRSLFVRRLDNLNFRQAAVGYTRPSTTAALVLLDELERQLVEFVLPATAAAAANDTLLVDLESLDPDNVWQKSLRERSAEIVKAAYSAPSGTTAAQVEELGDLFYRRRKLVRSWMKTLDKQRYKLRVPRRFIPEADYANELVGRIPLTDLREWRTIHERLMEADVLAAFELVLGLVLLHSACVALDNLVDYEREKIVVPKPILDILGIEKADDALDSEFAMYTAGETSAYLAELARGTDPPSLTLLTLAEFAFNRDLWGGAYCYAALIVMDGLAGQLGIQGEPLLAHRQINRAALTQRFLGITNKSEGDIRNAARQVWERWYEAKLSDVRREKTTTNAAWRH
ncbi:MAG: hypothetical protein IPK82_42275 [Polyangiaceae bacterium]|nr:hypothetical protein [Polyangiaceae bacterium]